MRGPTCDGQKSAPTRQSSCGSKRPTSALRESGSATPAALRGGNVSRGPVSQTARAFTAYADARGDAAALEVIERFGEAVDEYRGEHGTFVKRLGDGYMLAYPEAPEAVPAALRIAAAMRNVDGIEIHAGIHHGVAVFRDGDYFGRAVNLAARLLGAAGAGEILATEDVASSTAEYPWRNRGLRHLRGFAKPVDVYALESEGPA